jgi:crotonobetaine/carnitine-CoA ligase
MSQLRDIDIPLRERTVNGVLAQRAREAGERTYLMFDGQRFTYAEVDQLTNRLANGMRAAGVARGEHVALLFENRPEMLWASFALAKLGAVAVPLNTAAKGELLQSYLAVSECVTLVTEAALVERFATASANCPLITRMIVADLDAQQIEQSAARFGRQTLGWNTLLDASDEAPDMPTPVKVSDTFLLMFTSGTTGPSKANVSPHGRSINFGLRRVQAFGYQPEDVLYTCLPLFHGNALVSTCMAALVAGCSVALSRRFSVSKFWDEVREVGATQFNLLGVMANFLYNQPPSPRDREHTVRQCTMVPMPAFNEAFEERFGLRLTSVYSLSDFSLTTVLGPDRPAGKSRSAGVPVPGVTVAILDEDDMRLPTGQIGEIAMRTDEPWTTSQGYWGKPEATVEAWRNLWFHTGDRGYLDADGYLYFVDRKKDAIRRRGENISSWEVEQIVQRHPAVQEVAAFPVSGLSEDEVMVSVVPRAGQVLDPAELVRFCQENMAYFMVPRYIELVEALPRTLTEKIEKYKLRADAEARLADIWDREKAGIVVKR